MKHPINATEQKSAVTALALDALELREQHRGTWGEHPEHYIEAWQAEVASDATRLGYWEWVAIQVED